MLMKGLWPFVKMMQLVEHLELKSILVDIQYYLYLIKKEERKSNGENKIKNEISLCNNSTQM